MWTVHRYDIWASPQTQCPDKFVNAWRLYASVCTGPMSHRYFVLHNPANLNCYHPIEMLAQVWWSCHNPPASSSPMTTSISLTPWMASFFLLSSKLLSKKLAHNTRDSNGCVCVCACVCTMKCVTARKGYDCDNKSIKNGWQICHNFTLCFFWCCLIRRHVHKQFHSGYIPKIKLITFDCWPNEWNFVAHSRCRLTYFQSKWARDHLIASLPICVVTARFHSISEMSRIPLQNSWLSRFSNSVIFFELLAWNVFMCIK